MNRKKISGILCAGIISGSIHSFGAAFRDLYIALRTISGKVIFKGILVLNFVLAVANWDSGNTIISREQPILPISIILGNKWARYNQYARAYFTCKLLR